MDFAPSARSADLTARVAGFVADRVVPAEVIVLADIEARRARGDDPWPPHPLIAELVAAARAEGLWNLWLPEHDLGYAARFGTDAGAGLSNVDYATVAEAMGASLLAPLVMNSNAPDTGNMEVLLKYGTPEQREQWLEPLLDGAIRSAFLMTEPGVASSDATTMEATARLDGDEVVLDGRKWWSSGAGHPDCRLGVFMGRTDASAHKHRQHSMVLVPMDDPGVRIVRQLSALGQHDEPLGHGEVTLDSVRLPRSAIVGQPGDAFAIAQGRLGPGRVHHCMRLIGLAEMALDLACTRSVERVAFGRQLAMLGGNRERLAQARIQIDQARLLVLHAAWLLDRDGPAGAVSAVSAIKAVVPTMACNVIDMAIQLHGGAGMSEDLPLARAYAGARSLRLADGPDEVHLGVVARRMLAPYLAAARG